MWIPTKTEAVEMYAKFWTARHGDAASASARERAISFKMKGNLEGHKAWTNVADAIDDWAKNKRPRDKSR